MTNPINYKIEIYEGPLDLLVSLVEKNKINIEDIPIDLICTQYMEYIADASSHDIELACEFLYMASELMLIKSRMLLPRDPEKDEDPRKVLVDAIVEYQKAKLAASELTDLYSEYGSRMVKETDDISPDKTYVADQTVELLTAALLKVLSETPQLSNEKIKEKEFGQIVNAPRIPIHTVISSLIDNLKKSGNEIYLDSYFRDSSSKSEIIAKFIGILELMKIHTIYIEDDSENQSGVTDISCAHIKIKLISDSLSLPDELEVYQ